MGTPYLRASSLKDAGRFSRSRSETFPAIGQPGGWGMGAVSLKSTAALCCGGMSDGVVATRSRLSDAVDVSKCSAGMLYVLATEENIRYSGLHSGSEVAGPHFGGRL